MNEYLEACGITSLYSHRIKLGARPAATYHPTIIDENRKTWQLIGFIRK
jgi:hypothetical protein